MPNTISLIPTIINGTEFFKPRRYFVDGNQEFVGVDTFLDPDNPVEFNPPAAIENVEAVSFYISSKFYDAFGTTGKPGQVLTTDATKPYWIDITGVGTPLQTIALYDESIFKGVIANLNFIDSDDPDNLVRAQIGINSSFGEVLISDRWTRIYPPGVVGEIAPAPVYRNSKVGIFNESPFYELDVVGRLGVTSSVSLGSTLSVAGSVVFLNTLDVTGISSFKNNIIVDGTTSLNSTLDVDGATTLNSTLDVDGATTLNNTLDVDGATTLNLTLDVDGATTLNNTLDVDGATTLNNSLDVDGATTLNLTLDVDGATTLNNSLDVDGATTLNNTLDVTGISSFKNNIIVDGTTSLNNTLDVDGATTLNNSLDVDGSTTLNNSLDVDGATTLNNTLDVDGATTLNLTLDVDGATTLNNTLDVDGATTLNNSLDVDGATTLQTTLQVGAAGTVITTTAIGSVGFGTNAPKRDIDFYDRDVFFNSSAIYDTNDNVGFRTEQYQVPRNVLTTVGVDTTGSIIGGRFYDAANLIRLNLDYIANETVGFLTSTDYKSPAFSLGTTDYSSCKDDIKDILKAITYDITRGGNSRSVGAGLSYYTGNTLIHINGTDTNGYSIKDATIVAITTAAQVARYVINNLEPPKSYQGIGSVPLIRDLTLQDDPVVGFNTDPFGCSNVVSAIAVCAGIVTTIIGNGPSAAPKVNNPSGKVLWAPAGADSKNIIYVSKYGNDDNNGRTEGSAKLTIGAAAAVAQPGDTIMIRSGVYAENNPIGLRTDVSVSGQDLRLVTIYPQNDDDVFYVRRGCLIENLSFAYSKDPYDDAAPIVINGAAVAFPPPVGIGSARSGYLEPGPANEGPTGRWRSPYIRNCTNFMTNSTGMKIDGRHATASTIGNDLKCMVCDSFTQYNENGIGVSITNNGYAQLVSIFTINCNIAIYCDSGGSCDLTNSNSSFGNFGLVAVGLGSTEFTGKVSKYPPNRIQPGVDAGSDVVGFSSVFDLQGNPRRPYDGQALFFKIDLSNYSDTVTTGLSTTILQQPMVQIQSIKVINKGSGYSAVNPPTVIIRDADDLSQQPKGPQGIIAELSPTIDPITGEFIAIDVVNTGRNYLPTQNLEVFIDGGTATAEVVTQPIYYTVDSSTEPNNLGETAVTFNEFIPYELFGDEEVSFKRISRILTSSHSFEYIGTGTNINTATPFQGAVPIKENEVVALDGAQIPFTSTDQKGNFDIGEGFQINQPSATIRGRDFSKAIQAEVTPLILALR